MRHFALQTLTWGTIVGSTASALWLASKESLVAVPVPSRPELMVKAPPSSTAPSFHHLPKPAAPRVTPPPTPLVLLEAGQAIRR